MKFETNYAFYQKEFIHYRDKKNMILCFKCTLAKTAEKVIRYENWQG